MPHEPIIVQGEQWPSVTETLQVVNQSWIWDWYRREVKKHGWRGWQKCIATSNRGARLGSAVHDRLYSLFMKQEPEAVGKPEWQQKVRGLTDCLWQYVRDNQIDPVALEHKVISAEHRYGGTLDCVATVGGKPTLWLLDWKTSNSIDKMYAVQLAAYAQAWNENFPDQLIDHGGIIRVHKKTKTPYIQVGQFTNLHSYFPVFKACRTIWDYVYEQGPWKQAA